MAFLTEGDPLFYSTFVYLLREAPRRWPALAVEIVPGVTSATAVPAVAGLPLADGQERIAVLPGAYDLSDLEHVLDAFDTVIFMKIGPHMGAIIDALARKRLLDRAVYVSKATMPEQRIVRDLEAVRAVRGDCFGMLVVTRRQRAGVMLGEVPVAPLTPAKEAAT